MYQRWVKGWIQIPTCQSSNGNRSLNKVCGSSRICLTKSGLKCIHRSTIRVKRGLHPFLPPASSLYYYFKDPHDVPGVAAASGIVGTGSSPGAVDPLLAGAVRSSSPDPGRASFESATSHSAVPWPGTEGFWKGSLPCDNYEDVEHSLIEHFNPPLNIKLCRNPFKPTLVRLRAEARKDAVQKIST